MQETEASIIKKIIDEYYNVGEFTSFEKLYLGYINESYIIETLADGERRKFFLRKFRTGIKVDEIRFEHSIINHLTEKKFTLSAGVIQARDGNSYIRFSEKNTAKAATYALYDFLCGDDSYTWANPCCSEAHLNNAAIVLARYHNTVSDLNPLGSRHEPAIINLLPIIAQNLKDQCLNAGDTVFDAYLVDHYDLIMRTIVETLNAISTEAFNQLPKLVIHCDFHPGNLKFVGEQIVGLFDFDWSKLDVRAFDVALALFYFCTAWDEDGYQDGEFLLPQAALFLNAYQEALGHQSGMEPLSAIEVGFLPALINASNVYVLSWTLRDFYAKDVDAQEYLGYMRHSICLMKWLQDDENMGKIKALFDGMGD